eukprot:CAMPEP_0117891084 /NCGR_PEP_ID=MMETSP0950-20121206/23737_1 /TAXON_ID=44440 /ORGANISM="Chattonella subsalsa, Strain CCMP2191" /LENGTH=47 /DNA_ID= /DNA_START= /DNA_END= /DNA_ORIENTATION=
METGGNVQLLGPSQGKILHGGPFLTALDQVGKQVLKCAHPKDHCAGI